MNTVGIHIDETMSDKNFQELKDELLTDSHVANVAYHAKLPHDVLVEYEQNFVQPMNILHQLETHGLHVDIISA